MKEAEAEADYGGVSQSSLGLGLFKLSEHEERNKQIRRAVVSSFEKESL